MSNLICKKCGTDEHFEFEASRHGSSIWVLTKCTGCGDWIYVDVTPALGDLFEYFGPNRGEGTLRLDVDE